MNWVREGLYEPFRFPGSDLTVPAGTYDGWETQLRFWTNESAKVSFRSGANIGSFLSGSRRSLNGTLTMRPGSSFSTSIRLDYNNLTLKEGNYVATLAGVNLGYFFTPRIYLQSLVQYSTQLGHLLRQRALRMAQHGGDRPVHRLQRHPGDPGPARAAGPLADRQVQPAVQRPRRLTALRWTAPRRGLDSSSSAWRTPAAARWRRGFARMLAGGGVEASSGGSRPSGVVNPRAVESMAELGYDLGAHRSEGLDDVPPGPFDAVVTMGCGDACPHVPARRAGGLGSERPEGPSGGGVPRGPG